MSETDIGNEELATSEGPDKTETEVDDETVIESVDPEALAEVLDMEPAETELESVRREMEDWRARAYRAAADLDNARKRFQKEREDLRKYGSDGLLKDLLPVADNLDRALAHAGASDGLAEGVQMVLRLFHQILANHGAKPFDSKGEAFDPQIHEAMTQVPTDEQAPGTVVDVFQQGWTLHERLARPAMVTVAIAPEPASAEPESASDASEATEAGEITANDVDVGPNDVDNG